MAMFYTSKFKESRKQKNVTMTSLAEKLGISRRTLWAWENGERIPSDNKIYLLANYLNIKTEEISDLANDGPSEKMYFPKIDKYWKTLANEDEKQEDDTFHNFLHKINIYHNELKKSTVVIKALLSSMNIMLYIKNTDHMYITANRSFLENCSYPESITVHGKKDRFFFSQLEAIENCQQDEEVFKSGKEIVKYENYIPGSRKKKWGLISKHPIFSKKKEVIGLVGTFIDITSRKTAEETREVLGESLTTTSEAVFIANFNSNKYLYANDAVEKLYECSPEKFRKYGGKFWIDRCIYKDDIKTAIEIPEDPAQSIKKEYRIKTKSGKTKWISSIISPSITYLKQKCNIIIERDITEEKLNETKRERLEEAVNQLADCIWIGKLVDNTFLHFEYEYISDSITKLFDIKACEIYKNNVLLSDIKDKFFVKKITKEDKSVTIQYQMTKIPSTNPICFEEKIYEYKDGYYTGVIMDISSSIGYRLNNSKAKYTS
jgi:PAS domain S-box-containing protein